jgi:hypothetical protein
MEKQIKKMIKIEEEKKENGKEKKRVNKIFDEPELCGELK